MPSAFVTGASRSAGKAIAVHLARAGYDIAMSARTVQEGEVRDYSETVHRSEVTAWPGSLASTAQMVEREGQRALVVPADLTDEVAVIAAARTVLDEWGPVEVLVNCGRYAGPGQKDEFLESSNQLVHAEVQANLMSPLALVREFLPGMMERGSGVIVNMVSGAIHRDPPPHAVGDGMKGWSLGYAISKGGLYKATGVLNAELADRGIRVYGVQPGPAAMDRPSSTLFQEDRANVHPPDVVGAAVAWLITDPDAAEAHVAGKVNREVFCREVCRDLSLLPGWPE